MLPEKPIGVMVSQAIGTFHFAWVVGVTPANYAA